MESIGRGLLRTINRYTKQRVQILLNGNGNVTTDLESPEQNDRISRVNERINFILDPAH